MFQVRTMKSSSSQVEAMIQDAPSHADCTRNVAATIASKTPTNLIIHDRTNVLSAVSAEQFFQRDFLPEFSRSGLSCMRRE